MKRLLICGCLLLMGVVGCSRRGPLVARVGDADISLDQFNQDFSRNRTLEEVLNADFSEKKVHLDSMITEAILLQAARERNLENDPYVQYRIEPLKRYLLIRRLYELEVQERNQKMEEIHAGKKDIAWGSQIRSYILHPYRMVKDHRTGKEMGKVDAVLDGELDSFIRAYLLSQSPEGD